VDPASTAIAIGDPSLYAAPMPSHRVLYQSQDCAIALCDDVMVQIWEGHAHEDVLLNILGFFQSLKKGEFHDRKLYVLHVVAETASPPDAKGRAIAAKFLEYIEFHSNATEGTGFRASLIRSVIVGIIFLSRVRAKHSVSASVPEAARALVAAGCNAETRDLESCVSVLRVDLRTGSKG